MLGFDNKLFISVQLIVFLDRVLLLAELAQKFKSLQNSCVFMTQNFRGFTFIFGCTLSKHFCHSKPNLGLGWDFGCKEFCTSKSWVRRLWWIHTTKWLFSILVKPFFLICEGQKNSKANCLIFTSFVPFFWKILQFSLFIYSVSNTFSWKVICKSLMRLYLVGLSFTSWLW